jgi:hypothetical protein
MIPAARAGRREEETMGGFEQLARKGSIVDIAAQVIMRIVAIFAVVLIFFAAYALHWVLVIPAMFLVGWVYMKVHSNERWF